MQRTSVDGSFEEILEPSSLQDGVPLPEEVGHFFCVSLCVCASICIVDVFYPLGLGP